MSVTETNPFRSLKDFSFPPFIRREAKCLDARCNKDLKIAARLIVQGEAIIVPICGVMGIVGDATQRSGVDQIYEIKDRSRTQQLITAGSAVTRSRLIDSSKLHRNWQGFDFNRVYDLPTFVIFPSVKGLSKDMVRSDPEDESIDTIAIWWANYYQPVHSLERFMQDLKPESFIVGSSCNRSKQDSITDSRDAFEVFGKGRQRVAAIVYDKDFDEGRGLVKGSHLMLRISGGVMTPHRAGSVHTDSFKPILGDRLYVPGNFQNVGNAMLLDHLSIRQAGHYLKDAFAH